MQVAEVVRHKVGNTDSNLAAIIEEIAGTAVSSIVLLASPEERTEDFTGLDGADSSLPLVAAYSVKKVNGTHYRATIFDGPFLNAVRGPRYGEVRTLLNEAVKSGKVQFYDGRAPFTAGLKPEEAYRALSGLGPLQALTGATRPTYFRLLCHIPEDEIGSL